VGLVSISHESGVTESATSSKSMKSRNQDSSVLAVQIQIEIWLILSFTRNLSFLIW